MSSVFRKGEPSRLSKSKSKLQSRYKFTQKASPCKHQGTDRYTSDNYRDLIACHIRRHIDINQNQHGREREQIWRGKWCYHGRESDRRFGDLCRGCWRGESDGQLIRVQRKEDHESSGEGHAHLPGRVRQGPCWLLSRPA